MGQSMEDIAINSWDLRSIVAVSVLPNLNTNAAIQKIADSVNLEHFLKFRDLHRVSSSFAENKLFPSAPINIMDEADSIIETCLSKNIQIITYWSPQYPKLLKNIDFPPLMIYVRGKLQAQDANIISIVGTRHCTDYGKLCTEHFAETFVRSGLIIASGLATGIDTIAHLTAVRNSGITYAVIASGIDRISPSTSQANADKIVESGGAIISTYRPGTNALPPYFLQRNRIISGIAKALLVVESAYKGGSLNTARNANEQNREVYAVPGRINSERSKGTNLLIRKNLASIALSPEDIIEDLGLKNADNLFEKKQSESLNLSANQLKVLNSIDSEPIGIDKISEITALDISTVLIELLNLEFMNLVRQLPGKNYVRFNV